MGFSPCGENLRYHNPVLTNDSASMTFRRISLTSARISRMDERQNRMLATPPATALGELRFISNPARGTAGPF